MPIYSYECGKCGHKFDELVKGSETVACPECKSTKLNKLFAPFAVGSSSGPSSGCESGACPMAGGGCPGGSCGFE